MTTCQWGYFIQYLVIIKVVFVLVLRLLFVSLLLLLSLVFLYDDNAISMIIIVLLTIASCLIRSATPGVVLSLLFLLFLPILQ